MSLGNQILELNKSGLSRKEIKNQLNCSSSTVCYHLDSNYRENVKSNNKLNKQINGQKYDTILVKPTFCQTCKIKLEIDNTKGLHSKFCKSCNINYVDWSKVTLLDFKKRYKTKNKLNGRLRQLSRRNILDHKYECIKCGYSKFTEICHIKPISEFQDTDSIATINDKNNLVELCPNCHWEFDHDSQFRNNVLDSLTIVETTRF